jgi:ComF family protein
MCSILTHVVKSFVHLLYPPLCLHCQDDLSEKSSLFCKACFACLELVNPEERCPYCFSAEYSVEQLICTTCKEKKPFFNRMAAAFDYLGPAATLVKQMKYADQPYLAQGAGAFLAVQFLRLRWPQPDYIIPIPLAFMRMFDRGYNQSRLLAEALGKIIKCPVENALKRMEGGISQAGQNHRQRIQLKSEQFSVKMGLNLADKCLLLIDDVMTTGATMRCCAEVLLEQCPSSIYALTLCCAIK